MDYVTLETGLGGRLDATTAVENPVACVITSISLDHMQFLGNTVREIAGEKAGIIVPGVPVIYDGNDKDAAEVIAAKAKELGSPAYKVVQAGAKVLGNNKDGIDFSLEDDYYGDTRFHIPFIAWYQVMNASLALTTMEVLKDRIPVTMEQLQSPQTCARHPHYVQHPRSRPAKWSPFCPAIWYLQFLPAAVPASPESCLSALTW